MANVRKTCGLRPIEEPYGSIQVTPYVALTGEALYMYQPVTLSAGGSIGVFTCGSDGTCILGSIVGFGTTDGRGPIDNNYSGYVPAAPAANQLDANGHFRVFVADDPNQRFIIEEDTGGSALTLAAVGAGGNFTYLATTGNTVNGWANVVIDRSDVGVAPSSNLPIQLIRKWDKEDNAYGDYCKWVVRLNNHQYNPCAAVGGNNPGII